MSGEAQLALLRVTGQGKAVSYEEFLERSRQPNIVRATINTLAEEGMVSITNGFLNMNNSQRMALAEELIHAGSDPVKVSRVLEWQEFEDFANDTLLGNGFQCLKHFVFKSSLGRREIDILAWNDNFALAIDCKHWRRGMVGRRMGLAAKAQAERTSALANRPELLARAKMRSVQGRTIIPLILTMGDVHYGTFEGVPIVPISKLVNFLYGVSPMDQGILQIHIGNCEGQSFLL